MSSSFRSDQEMDEQNLPGGWGPPAIDYSDSKDGLRIIQNLETTTEGADSTAGVKQSARRKVNVLQVSAALFSSFVLGMNDTAYAVLIPYLSSYYHINHTVVAVVFITPFIGYVVAACTSKAIHNRFGQLGVAVIAPFAKIIAYAVICAHPPYAALPVMYVFCGFGNGLEDGAWNAWMSSMERNQLMMGLLHGAYGLGAALSPLVASTMVAKGHLPWYNFYYFMLAIACVEWAFCIYAFRGADGAAYQIDKVFSTDVAQKETTKSNAIEALGNHTTWLAAVFLLTYTGVECGVGAWLPTFMLSEYNATHFESGLSLFGYWLAVAVGRVVLALFTDKVSEKVAVSAYLLAAFGLEMGFWLSPTIVSSSVCVAILGFFLGPILPATIVVATKLLPPHLHASGVGFVTAAGAGGGCLIPFILGGAAQADGIVVIQPMLVAFIGFCLVLWVFLCGIFSKKPRV